MKPYDGLGLFNVNFLNLRYWEPSLRQLSSFKSARLMAVNALKMPAMTQTLANIFSLSDVVVKICCTCFLVTSVSVSTSFAVSAATNNDCETACEEAYEEGFLDTLEIKGFGTIGYTNAKKYEDRAFRRNVYQDGERLRDNGFLVDSRIGMQVTGEIGAHWDFMFLGVYKEQYGDDFIDYIDAAFLRYNSTNNWQVSLGRQPFDVFFLSDHRNVGYSYDWVRPPTEFYGFIPYDSFDGIKVSHNWGDFDNDWTWNISVGFIEEKFENQAFEDDRPDAEDVTEARPIYNTELRWRRNNWTFRANYAYLKFKQDLDDSEDIEDLLDELIDYWPELPELSDDFVANTNMRYVSLGAQWEKGDWKIQTEISKVNADFIHYNGWRGYFHVHKRFGEFMPYATFGYARDNSDRSFRRIPNAELPDDPWLRNAIIMVQRGMEQSIRSVRQNQRSFAMGVRWDFARQKAAKFQCDQYWFDDESGSVHGLLKGAHVKDDTRSWCSLTFDWVF